MNVVIRADSSALIGTGHIMRCLTLAECLRKEGATVTFVTRDFDESAKLMIDRRGFDSVLLPFFESDRTHAESLRGYDKWLAVDWQRDARETVDVVRQLGHTDWLVVDHYALDREWEAKVKSYVDQLLVIDDISNRRHDCEVLLDHNYGHDDNRYDALVPKQCKKLLGSDYALLRDEFARARTGSGKRSGYIERILVFYGGADANNDTGTALRAIASLTHLEPHVDVVIGSANRFETEITALASSMPKVQLHSQVSIMSDLMSRADLCLGAAGTTSWERCCLGLPTLMTAVAENQISIARAIHDAGAGIYLGQSDVVTEVRLKAAIEDLAISPRGLIGMSKCAMALVDGHGAKRVCNVMSGTREVAIA